MAQAGEMGTGIQVTVRSFAVLLDRRAQVDKDLSALVKRAARKGIAGCLTWTWGEPYKSEVRLPAQDAEHRPLPSSARYCASTEEWVIPVVRVPLELTGEAPKLQGWCFVATLQRVEGENIVRVLPGEQIPPSYRTAASFCDHCCTARRRNDTYVLRHDDGRLIQVGSSCIRDFLGNDDAAIIAAKAELLALAASVISEGDDDWFGSGGSAEISLGELLPIVAWIVRARGWVSRTAARESFEVRSTADWAWQIDTSREECLKSGYDPNDDDFATAEAAEAWASSLTDELVNESSSDYLHNLRAVCRTGLVSFRTAGIAASAVVAYQRHVARERARAERAAQTLDAHVGEVGSRVSFGLPPKLGKKGQPLKNAPVVLSADPVVLDFVTGYETDYGYTTVLKFRTPEGAELVWKASSTEVKRSDVGKRYTLIGSVKEHAEYKGAKQTVVSRCDLREVAEA